MEKCPVCGESRDICYNVGENVYVCGRCGVKFEMYRYDEKSETIKPAVPLKEDICPCCGEKENITIIHERICNNCGINF